MTLSAAERDGGNISKQEVIEALGKDVELYWRGKKLAKGDPVPFDLRIDDPKDLAIYVENNGKNVLRAEIYQKLGLQKLTSEEGK